MTIRTRMQRINKKIPGALLPTAKSEIDGKLKDLSSKTIPELLELRDRQSKLLSNKSFVSKLPDKGEKIQQLHDRIVQELKAKQVEERTCKLLERLSLNVGQQSVQDIEWEGKVKSTKDGCLDSDDDSDPEDVLQIISSGTATQKTVKVLQGEKPLITPEDLKEIVDMPHVKYIVDKTESTANKKRTEHFKPYKTTKSDVHNPEKEILRKKHKHWEVTAATPPPIVHCPAKILSLEESLKLQKYHNIHLKEVEAQHAADRLLERGGIKMATLSKDVTTFGTYRDADSETSEVSDAEGSDKEVHDEEPERGGVVFTIMK